MITEEPPTPVASAAPCIDSPLDFMTYDDGRKAITYLVGKNHRKKFREQLVLCNRCTIREECLERAYKYEAKIGIWGGTLPHERYER